MNQNGSRKPAALIRERKAIDADIAAILSNHRIVAPFGGAGGAPGATGHNWVRRADGRVEELSGRDKTEMAAGDVFVIETPGGGGYSEPASD